MTNHTCASRKTAQVRTAAVVSWPAISIVIKSSLSCHIKECGTKQRKQVKYEKN